MGKGDVPIRPRPRLATLGRPASLPGRPMPVSRPPAGPRPSPGRPGRSRHGRGSRGALRRPSAAPLRPAAVAGLALLLALASMSEPPADPAAATAGGQAAGTELPMAPAGEVGFDVAGSVLPGSGWPGSDVEVGFVVADPDVADANGADGEPVQPRPALAGEQAHPAESGGDHGAPLGEGEARALALRLATHLAGHMSGRTTGAFVVDQFVVDPFGVDPFGVGRAERPRRPAALDTVLLDQLER